MISTRKEVTWNGVLCFVHFFSRQRTPLPSSPARGPAPGQVWDDVVAHWTVPELRPTEVTQCGALTHIFETLAARNVQVAVCTSDDRAPARQSCWCGPMDNGFLSKHLFTQGMIFICFFSTCVQETHLRPIPEFVFFLRGSTGGVGDVWLLSFF